MAMTRARKASLGFGPPPPLHRWMDAVLMLFAELVQGAASTLRMIFNFSTRECHARTERDALPEATSSIPETGPNPSTVILGLVPRIPFAALRGTNTYSPEALNQDPRHRAEHDTIGVDAYGSVEHAFPAQAGIQSARNARSSSDTPGLSSRKTRSVYRGPIRLHSKSAKWLPARAALGRNDNRELSIRLT